MTKAVTPTTTAGPRERILTAAADLFVREGINAVGVDRLSQQANVSKRTLYQQFGTKDAVVAAMLTEHGTRLPGGSMPAEDDGSAPLERILAVFDWLAGLAAVPGFTGCPFVNISTELRDVRTHPAVAAAQDFKSRLTGYFRSQLEQLGAARPEATALQLTMLFDGACAYGVMYGAGLPDAVPDAVRALVRAG